MVRIRSHEAKRTQKSASLIGSRKGFGSPKTPKPYKHVLSFRGWHLVLGGLQFGLVGCRVSGFRSLGFQGAGFWGSGLHGFRDLGNLGI